MEVLDALHDLEKRFAYLDKAFREVVEYSNSLIVRWNRHGIIYMNPRAREFFGYSEEEVLGKDVGILISRDPRSREKVEAMIGEILRHPEKNINVDNENVKKNGERAWVAWVNTAVTDEKGEVEIIAVGNDITHMKQREQRLSAEAQEFKSLVDNALNIVVRWDRDFRFLYANPRIADIRGKSPAYYIGKTIADLHLKDGDALMDAVRRAFDTGVTQRIEVDLDTPHGMMILEQLLVPEISGGRVVTVMGVGRDITGIKQSRERMEIELERSKRLSDLGQLAASVAHELRNPLASIKMAAYNIRRKTKDDRIAGNIATIEKKVEESNKIISDVLAYGRIKPPEYRRVEIALLVRESLSDARMNEDNAGVKVEDRLSGLEGVIIDADPRQLKEVFTNLIDNACDAVKDVHGRQGLVTLEGEDLGSDVRVTVRDNGIGMDEETLRKLNKPFFTTKSQGTGLGLTISRQIVDLHKASLDILSERDCGTSVTVLLPKSRR